VKVTPSSNKTLSLKRSVEQGTVRQTFPHGRSKQVVVEKVKRRVAPGEGKAAETPPPAREPPRRGGAATGRGGSAGGGSGGRPSGVVLRQLTEEERSARAQALAEAKVNEVHERRQAEEVARQRAERDAAVAAEREQAEARKREEDDRHRQEEDARRKAEAEARVAEFRDFVSKFQTLVDQGKLKVKVRDGTLVVQLATDILFASGKADLSQEGLAAIREVGAVLATIGDKRFQIEGHTDNVPIKTSRFPSNWELAAARAITVVKTLIDAGMPPQRVSAASFGDSFPAVPNDSPVNKATNRRIEIVVVPDLSSLPGFNELQNLGR